VTDFGRVYIPIYPSRYAPGCVLAFRNDACESYSEAFEFVLKLSVQNYRRRRVNTRRLYTLTNHSSRRYK